MYTGKHGAFGAGIYFGIDPVAARLKAIMASLPKDIMNQNAFAADVPISSKKQGEYIITVIVTDVKWKEFQKEHEAKQWVMPPMTKQDISKYDDDIDGGMSTGNVLQADIRIAAKKGQVFEWDNRKWPLKQYPVELAKRGKQGVKVKKMEDRSYGEDQWLQKRLSPRSLTLYNFGPYDWTSQDIDWRSKGKLPLWKARRALLIGPEYVLYDTKYLRVKSMSRIGTESNPKPCNMNPDLSNVNRKHSIGDETVSDLF